MIKNQYSFWKGGVDHLPHDQGDHIMRIPQYKQEWSVHNHHLGRGDGEWDEVNEGGGGCLGPVLVHSHGGLVQDSAHAQLLRLGHLTQLTLLWNVVIYRIVL